MTIRKATLADIDAMIEAGAAMHAESPRFQRMTYAPSKVRNMLTSLIDSPRGFVMVAEHGAVLEGGMVGAASEHWACDALVAFDIALFVLPDRRGGIAAARLLKAFAAWCKEQGAVIATAGISTQVHPDQSGALYRALGFKEIGPVFDVLGE